VDDLIATGGPQRRGQLLRQLGAEVLAACFIIDLPDLAAPQAARARRAGAHADFVRGH
jgi:adenine phosphoribosyltransferase